MKTFLISIVSLCVCGGIVLALDNGLGLTPVMGWLSWQRYRCNIDCKNQPDECISEWLYRRMADRLVEDGYRNAGYVYVNINDCWSSHERHPVTKRLQPDPERFPSGIPALAKYMHDRGLKLGIYGDVGTKTCAGYPGSENFYEIDAQTFADWGVDMLKLDGCFIKPNHMDYAFPLMTAALNKTGKPILFSCVWPTYQVGLTPDYAKIQKSCNIWRNFHDIDDSWISLKSIIDFYVFNQNTFVPVAKPGAFHDPDMLIIGDFGLSVDQAQTQMALWAIFASPLLMSNNLENIDPRQREILLNPYVIAVNQDRDGIMGHLRGKVGSIHVFTRPVQPFVKGSSSMAIAVVNRSEGGGPVRSVLGFQDLGLSNNQSYIVTDLFDNNKHLGKLSFGQSLILNVNPSGVRFVKATCVDQNEEEKENSI